MLTYGDGMPHLVKPEALGPGCYRYSGEGDKGYG